jgi:ribosome-binding factor A
MTVKQERMNERVREILSELLLTQVKDPQLAGVSVNNVDLDRELRVAKVYVHAMDGEESKDAVLDGLERAKGYLRSQVGAAVRLRHTPELRFLWDDTVEHAERVNALLDSLDIPADPDAQEADD